MARKTRRTGGFRSAMRRAYHRVRGHKKSLAVAVGAGVTAIFIATDKGGGMEGKGYAHPSLIEYAQGAWEGQTIVPSNLMKDTAAVLTNIGNWVPLGGGVAGKVVANKVFHVKVPLTKNWVLF